MRVQPESDQVVSIFFRGIQTILYVACINRATKIAITLFIWHIRMYNQSLFHAMALERQRFRNLFRLSY